LAEGHAPIAGGDEYAISVAASPAAGQSAHRRSANPNRRRDRTHRRSWFATARKGARR